MIKGLYEAHLPVSDLQKSVLFYQKLGLELAYKQNQLAFFWIVKGESSLGLWESKEVLLDYHPSIRHIAFRIDEEDLLQVKEWLQSIDIEVRTAFGYSPAQQPLVLPNYPYAHAAIYFADPDGNSIELISPIQLDVDKEFPMMSLNDWTTA
ncbi:VOC family protein [Lysinibacillus sp. NPDC097195]|uniref:VOC family protein n=1 Tax=Lysinibacillus sp. NPDC097195 TaxID=3364141 RepID=UPI0037F35762